MLSAVIVGTVLTATVPAVIEIAVDREGRGRLTKARAIVVRPRRTKDDLQMIYGKVTRGRQVTTISAWSMRWHAQVGLENTAREGPMQDCPFRCLTRREAIGVLGMSVASGFVTINQQTGDIGGNAAAIVGTERYVPERCRHPDYFEGYPA